MKSRFLAMKMFMLWVCLAGIHQTVWAEDIGSIKEVSGDAWLMSEGKAWRLHVDDTVDSAQTIITEEDGLVRVALMDGSLLNVAPRTRLKLNKYVVEKAESFSFDVLWGKVRYQVFKIIDPNAAFNVKTTTAAIGIRGTDFEVRMPSPEDLKGLEFSPSADLTSIGLQTTTVDMQEGLAVLTDLKGREHEMPAGTITTADKEGHVIQKVKGAPEPRPVVIPKPTVTMRKIVLDKQKISSQSSVTTQVNASALQSATITPPRATGFGGR